MSSISSKIYATNHRSCLLDRTEERAVDTTSEPISLSNPDHKPSNLFQPRIERDVGDGACAVGVMIWFVWRIVGGISGLQLVVLPVVMVVVALVVVV